jgi:hypothetical protein
MQQPLILYFHFKNQLHIPEFRDTPHWIQGYCKITVNGVADGLSATASLHRNKINKPKNQKLWNTITTYPMAIRIAKYGSTTSGLSSLRMQALLAFRLPQ